MKRRNNPRHIIEQGTRRLFKGIVFLGTAPTRKLQEAIDYLYGYLRADDTPVQFSSRLLSIFLTCTVLATGVLLYAYHFTNVPREVSFMLGIFVLACLLWITEALPLFATALLVIGLEIIFLSNPASWGGLGFENNASPDFLFFLAPIADPVIILFLGGFMMARAVAKRKIDASIAAYMLRFFGARPQRVLLGVMVITVLFSMWISNTATTTMMITMAMPLLAGFKQVPAFEKAVMISIPVAANIGGMGTPIASPPNALAQSLLQSKGISVAFWEWMMVGIPATCLMLWIAYKIISYHFKMREVTGTVTLNPAPISASGRFVILIFLTTVILWLTEPLHGLPTAVVALIPIIAFTASGQLSGKDINGLDWSTLLLIAGGIALGKGITVSGLDTYVTRMIPTEAEYFFPVLGVATLLLSTLISNTAAVNLLIPLGISVAWGLSDQSLYFVKEICIGIALIASMGMGLPVSTPSNSIAYAHGKLTGNDFLKTGLVIGIAGTFLMLLIAYLLRLIFV